MKTLRNCAAAAAWILTLLAFARLEAARADCPMSGIAYGCNDVVESFFASPSSDLYGNPWSAGSPCPYGCYDLPRGTLHAEASGSLYSKGCASGAEGHDLYTLANAPAGPPVACQAILQITGSLTGNGFINASLENVADPGGNLMYLVTTPTPNVTAQLVLPLSLTPGQPVHLESMLTVGGNYPAGTAIANAVLRFSGLPTGVGVVSCWSYDVPVPAQSATWGRLKAVYR